MRATRKDNDAVVEQIEIRAKVLGLLPPAGRLVYVPGKGRFTPEVSAYSDRGMHHPLRADFLPQFLNGYNTTLTDTFIILSATNTALAALERTPR